MKQLNLDEVEAVSGGIAWKVIAEAIVSSALYDGLKIGIPYLMANSHMGQGNFPPVPRAGRE